MLPESCYFILDKCVDTDNKFFNWELGFFGQIRVQASPCGFYANRQCTSWMQHPRGIFLTLQLCCAWSRGHYMVWYEDCQEGALWNIPPECLPAALNFNTVAFKLPLRQVFSESVPPLYHLIIHYNLHVDLHCFINLPLLGIVIHE